MEGLARSAARSVSAILLFNHLGLGEDSFSRSLRPDCADFVYFLRAYFAFKMGLPFAYSNCSRGAGGAPPRCSERFDILHPQMTRPAPPPEQAMASVAAPSTPTPAAAPPRLSCSSCFHSLGQVHAAALTPPVAPGIRCAEAAGTW